MYKSWSSAPPPKAVTPPSVFFDWMAELQAALLVLLGAVSTLLAGASVGYVNLLTAIILSCRVESFRLVINTNTRGGSLAG